MDATPTIPVPLDQAITASWMTIGYTVVCVAAFAAFVWVTYRQAHRATKESRQAAEALQKLVGGHGSESRNRKETLE